MLEGISGIDVIVFVTILFIFFSTAGGVVGRMIYLMRWPFRYEVYENLSGNGYRKVRWGRCRLVPFGDGGEEVFYLRGVNKFRVAYGKRIGIKQVAWAVGEDGLWYNVTFSDFNKKLMEVGIMPVDRDIRYAHASVRKGIENRYNQKSFMDKYGTIIAFGMLFICIIAISVGWYMSADKNAKAAATNLDVAKANKEVMTLQKEVLSGINYIKSGGNSGLVEVK